MHCTSCGTILHQQTIHCPVCGAFLASEKAASWPPTSASSVQLDKTPPASTDASSIADLATARVPSLPVPAPSTPQPAETLPAPADEPAISDYETARVPSQDGPALVSTYATAKLPTNFRVPRYSNYTATAVFKQRKNVLPYVFFAGFLALVACIALSMALYLVFKNAASSPTAPAPTAIALIGPSGQKVLVAAATIITNPQMAPQIDNNYSPIHPTSMFIAGQTAYVVFKISSNNHAGYVQARWYGNNQLIDMKTFTHDPANPVGYFSLTYRAATQGIVELFWCSKADCSDAQLAQIVHFTYTDSMPTPTGTRTP